MPERLPEFYRYLLSYPREKPTNVEDLFYWAKVKFGLKPTLRMVHVVTTTRDTVNGRGYVVAEKQLYASHYFQAALDLTFCITEPLGAQTGFYLIKVLGSEQTGLTGFRGSIVQSADQPRLFRSRWEPLRKYSKSGSQQRRKAQMLPGHPHRLMNSNSRSEASLHHFAHYRD